jgi:hypothetical protein
VIFGYTLAEAKKAVVSAIFLIAAAVGLFTTVDPNFTQAVIVLAGSAFATAGVFLSPKLHPDDLSKAVAQLQGSVISVVGYFAVVSPSTAEQLTVLTGLVVSTYLVFRLRNKG